MTQLIEAQKKVKWNDDLRSLYKRFPAMVRSKDWQKVVALAISGEIDQAWEIAHAAEKKNFSFRVQNIISRSLRTKRVALFQLHTKAKKDLAIIFNRIGTALADKILARADSTRKVAGLQKEAKQAATDLRVELRKWLGAILRQSTVLALKNAGDTFQPILKDKVNLTKEAVEEILTERQLLEEPLNFPTKDTRGFTGRVSIWTKKWTGVRKNIVKTILKSNELGLSANERIVELTQRASNEMSKIIANNIAQGEGPAVTARKIKKFLSPAITSAIERGEVLPQGVYGSIHKNAMRLARTESNRAYTHAGAEWAKGKSFIKGVRINLSPNHEQTDDCDALPQLGVISPDEAQSLLPVHPHNILPDQMVLAPDVVAATKAFYEGGCIEFTFADGRKISVTEGHPILTKRGWVLAKEINEFDQAIYAIDGQRIATTINPEYEQRPAAIEDVFRSLEKSSKMFSTRMKLSSEDFNGDGEFIKGDIHIVGSNRFLLRDRKPSLLQRLGKLSFNGRNILVNSLKRLGAVNQGFNTGLTPALSNVGFSCKCLSLGSIHTRVASLDRYRGMDTGSSRLRKSINSSQSIFDRLKTGSVLAHKFTDRFASLIGFNDIVSIKKFNYSGHVYDLQCKEYGLFNCNGAFAKNCMCYLAYEVEDRFLDKEAA